MPWSASPEQSGPRNTSSARADSSPARSRTTSICSTAVRPSGERPLTPAAIWSFRPAMRTWKNSSRFWLKMARNLTRSRSGVWGSSARARTRALKSSQDSSRLRYRRWPSVGSWSADMVAGYRATTDGRTAVGWGWGRPGADQRLA